MREKSKTEKFGRWPMEAVSQGWTSKEVARELRPKVPVDLARICSRGWE